MPLARGLSSASVALLALQTLHILAGICLGRVGDGRGARGKRSSKGVADEVSTVIARAVFESGRGELRGTPADRLRRSPLEEAERRLR